MDIQKRDEVLLLSATNQYGAWHNVMEVSGQRVKVQDQVDRRNMRWINESEIQEHTPRGR